MYFPSYLREVHREGGYNQYKNSFSKISQKQGNGK